MAKVVICIGAILGTCYPEVSLVTDSVAQPVTKLHPSTTNPVSDSRTTSTVQVLVREPEVAEVTAGDYEGSRAGLLACIRSYEGGYTTNTGNGYYGAYQFLLSTWQAVGGTGLPSDAEPEEQDRLAWKLYQEQGLAPWPTPRRECAYLQ